MKSWQSLLLFKDNIFKTKQFILMASTEASSWNIL